MRQMVRLFLVLLALASEAAAQPGPELTALFEQRTVGVRLKNGGARPLPLHLGWSCGGPLPFTASIDGAERSFVSAERTCTVNTHLAQTLAPGSSTVIWSSTLVLDRAAHRLQVRYSPRHDQMFDAQAPYWAGEATSPLLAVPATLADHPALGARLAIIAWVEAGELAVRFQNDGPLPIHLYLGRGCNDRRGATPGEGVFTKEINGKSTAFIPPACATPRPLVETLVPNARLLMWLGKVEASGRLDRVVVRYQVRAAKLAPEYRDAWSGELASAPIKVDGKQ